MGILSLNELGTSALAQYRGLGFGVLRFRM